MNRTVVAMCCWCCLAGCGGKAGEGVDTLAPDVSDASSLEVYPETGTDLASGDVHPDAAGDTGVADLPVEVQVQLSVGQDLDQHSVRQLESAYELPAQFFSALEDMGLELKKLTFSDFGLTFDWDKTRLHWTDTIRHEGHLAPTLAYMVVEDVEGAAALPDDSFPLRELLVAQYTYGSREDFVVSRYDRETLADSGAPLLEALRQFYEYPVPEGHPSAPADSFDTLVPELTARLSTIPLTTRVALAQAVLGLLEAVSLRDQALTGSGLMTLEEWDELHSGLLSGNTVYTNLVVQQAHPALDFELMSRAGQVAARATESLRRALTETDGMDGAYLEIQGALGKIVVDLEDRDNTWMLGPGFLLVDHGGNDTYLNQVATNTSIYNPVSVVLDLAGNDEYRLSKEWELGQAALLGPRLPSQGAGICGVALLDDAGGDDSYRCPVNCQGYGAFGVGALVDHGGDDVYMGYDLSQGSAQLGFGLLFDRGEGKDEYETLQNSQGYGGPRGIGWLVDDGGDDSYLARKDPIVFDWAGEGTNFSGSQGFAFGFRGGPYLSGGLGALFDLGGDDRYQCAVMCQGFGYFFGTGLFYDQQGNDEYILTHKYGIGAATHQSVGLFIDGGGEDSYTNTGDDESIGLGYDHGVAFHIDRGPEDDQYTVENIGNHVVGYARHPSMGVLINEGGDDTYFVPGEGQRSFGRSEVDSGDRDGPGKGIVTLGLFLDLGGTGDVYETAREEVQNGNSWRQTEPMGGDWTPDLDFAMGVDTE